MGEQAILDQVIEDFYPGENEPGCAAMLWRGGTALFAARGIADMKSGAPITPETNFRLASVSKQFTAACILHLYQRGLLRLGETLCDLFPGFPDYGKLIEIEHLLRHTSGVKDYEKLIPEEQTMQLSDQDVLTLIAAEYVGDFLPGEQFRYSNTGYVLLAMAVEAVSGQNFADYLADHIFAPLGMEEALGFVDGEGLPVPQNRAIGYEIQDDGTAKWADQNVTTATLGDGGIYCSVADYARWIDGYMGGKVVARHLVAASLRPAYALGGQVVPYGYGWRLEKTGDAWQPYHPGSTSGFRNGVLLDPGGDWAVAVFSNRRNGDAVAVTRRIKEVFQLR